MLPISCLRARDFCYICNVIERELNIAVVGAGNRARKYLSCLPGNVRLRCIVEPDPLRLSLAAKHHGVPESGCYSSPEAFFAAYHKLDAVIIAAPDREHVALALEAVRHGWHVLLEKPAATCAEDYEKLLKAAEAAGVHIGLCLEMRHHPYFHRIYELVKEGAVGEVLEIDHTEHIGPDRMAHSFVRGPWVKKAETGPVFLSKCCHDADFLLWLTGGSVEEVRSSGALLKFRPGNTRTPLRCIDCTIPDCPYSAVNLYRERREWVAGFDVPDGGTLEDVIDEELRSGRYGRCVYHCDNDVFDTQDVLARLSNGISLNLHLEGTSMEEGRTTIITGTRGKLVAENWKIGLGDVWEDYSHLATLPLHAGADAALVRDFFSAVSEGREPGCSLASALEGHKLCFLAG